MGLADDKMRGGRKPGFEGGEGENWRWAARIGHWFDSSDLEIRMTPCSANQLSNCFLACRIFVYLCSLTADCTARLNVWRVSNISSAIIWTGVVVIAWCLPRDKGTVKL